MHLFLKYFMPSAKKSALIFFSTFVKSELQTNVPVHYISNLVLRNERQSFFVTLSLAASELPSVCFLSSESEVFMDRTVNVEQTPI